MVTLRKLNNGKFKTRYTQFLDCIEIYDNSFNLKNSY